MWHRILSVVNKVSRKVVKTGEAPSGHEALKRCLLVICWCCLKWLGPATERKTVHNSTLVFSKIVEQSVYFLWFCIQPRAFVCATGADSVYYALKGFDTTADKEHVRTGVTGLEDRRWKAPFKAGLSNLSSSDPIQFICVFFPDKHCIYSPTYNTFPLL